MGMACLCGWRTLLHEKQPVVDGVPYFLYFTTIPYSVYFLPSNFLIDSCVHNSSYRCNDFFFGSLFGIPEYTFTYIPVEVKGKKAFRSFSVWISLSSL